MRDATIDEVRGYVEQLIADGLLQQTGDEYPILHITAEGARAAEGCRRARRTWRWRGRSGRTPAPKRARVETECWEGVDRDLFEALRALRLEIARRRRVPPYVIFHDTTLRELARSSRRRTKRSGTSTAWASARRRIWGIWCWRWWRLEQEFKV